MRGRFGAGQLACVSDKRMPVSLLPAPCLQDKKHRIKKDKSGERSPEPQPQADKQAAAVGEAEPDSKRRRREDEVRPCSSCSILCDCWYCIKARLDDPQLARKRLAPKTAPSLLCSPAGI